MKRTDITELFPEATKEQIDKLLDINGADINSAKGSVTELQAKLTAAQAEIDGLKAKDPGGAVTELQTQLGTAQAELAALKAANALRDLRAKVSRDTGVPADLLTGETEEACKSQAEAIKAYSDSRAPAGYPKIKDSGEPRGSGAAGTATRDLFANFMQEKFPEI